MKEPYRRNISFHSKIFGSRFVNTEETANVFIFCKFGGKKKQDTCTHEYTHKVNPQTENTGGRAIEPERAKTEINQRLK